MIHLDLIERRTAADFTDAVSRFFSANVKLVEIKFQRNIYYSLAGSPKKFFFLRKERSLEQTYLAFILWRDKDEA